MRQYSEVPLRQLVAFGIALVGVTRVRKTLGLSVHATLNLGVPGARVHRGTLAQAESNRAALEALVVAADAEPRSAA